MPLSLPPQAQKVIDEGITHYTVKENDTIAGIAERFNLKPTSIFWANNLSAQSRIKPGQTLKILPIDGVLHKVTRGETLGSISLAYKVYTEDIIGVNNLLSADGLIFVNQELIIPGASPLPSAPKSHALPQASSERIIADVRGTLVNPAPGSHRSQGLHWRNAVDLANGCGNPVVAAAAGTILQADGAGWNGGFGKYIIISHPSGIVTVYGHLSELFVEADQEVAQGQRIGSIGATGHATGCHVHFEVRGAVNPFGY